MKRLIIVSLLAIFALFLAGCGEPSLTNEPQTISDTPESGTETASSAPESETGGSDQALETSTRTFPLLENCPLTIDLVRNSCNIRTTSLILEEGEDKCWIFGDDRQSIIGVDVDTMGNLYEAYSVSNFRDAVDAEIQDITSDQEYCEVKQFPWENVGEEAILTSGYEIISTETSCRPKNAITDLRTFDFFIEAGDNFIYGSSGYYPRAEGGFDEGCTLEEAASLIRVLLGQEVEEERAITECADQACFEEKFRACEAASFQLSLMPGLTYYYEIVGPADSDCQVKSRFVENPNPAFVGPEMSCVYDNSQEFGTAVQDMSGCEGSLYSLMAGS